MTVESAGGRIQLWSLAIATIALAPASLSAQASDTSLVAITEWLDQNVVSLVAPPVQGSLEALVTFRTNGCHPLLSTWTVRPWDRRGLLTLRVSAPITWRRISVRTARSLPRNWATMSGGAVPVPKTLEGPPMEAPGVVLKLEYSIPQVTAEGWDEPREAQSGFYLTMVNWEAADQVKEKLTRLAQLCATR